MRDKIAADLAAPPKAGPKKRPAASSDLTSSAATDTKGVKAAKLEPSAATTAKGVKAAKLDPAAATPGPLIKRPASSTAPKVTAEDAKVVKGRPALPKLAQGLLATYMTGRIYCYKDKLRVYQKRGDKKDLGMSFSTHGGFKGAWTDACTSIEAAH